MFYLQRNIFPVEKLRILNGTLLEVLWYGRLRDHEDVHGFRENGAAVEQLLITPEVEGKSSHYRNSFGSPSRKAPSSKATASPRCLLQQPFPAQRAFARVLVLGSAEQTRAARQQPLSAAAAAPAGDLRGFVLASAMASAWAASSSAAARWRSSRRTGMYVDPRSSKLVPTWGGRARARAARSSRAYHSRCPSRTCTEMVF